jgi:hypothetical protein
MVTALETYDRLLLSAIARHNANRVIIIRNAKDALKNGEILDETQRSLEEGREELLANKYLALQEVDITGYQADFHHFGQVLSLTTELVGDLKKAGYQVVMDLSATPTMVAIPLSVVALHSHIPISYFEQDLDCPQEILIPNLPLKIGQIHLDVLQVLNETNAPLTTVEILRKMGFSERSGKVYNAKINAISKRLEIFQQYGWVKPTVQKKPRPAYSLTAEGKIVAGIETRKFCQYPMQLRKPK